MDTLNNRTAEPTPGIGHNQAPEPLDPIAALGVRLSSSHRGLVVRFAELELGCARVPDPIATDEDAGLATDFVAQCQTHIRQAEAAHRQEKAFFLQASRAVDSFFKRRCEKLNGAIGPVVTRLRAYREQLAEAERRRHEVAQRAAEEEARDAADEAARHSAEAERLERAQDRTGAAEQQLLAQDAVVRAEIARRQAVTPPEPARIRGDYGATAYVARRWTFEVVDLDRVPRGYMSLDVDVVREAITKDGVRDIPGLRIFQAETLRVRGVA